MKFVIAASVFLLTACGSDDGVPGYDDLSRHVEDNKVGQDSDQWIEMTNLAGQWERTGLIFGYAEDYEECQKAIAGLKKVNTARDYRCTRAN